MRAYLLICCLAILGLSGCQSVLQSRPQKPPVEALVDLSWSHMDAGRHHVVGPLLDYAERFDPQNMMVKAARAEWHRTRGEDDAAVKLYQRFWNREPVIAMAYGRWMLNDANPTNLAHTVKVLDRAVADVDLERRSESLMLRSEAYHRQGDLALAAQDLQEVLRLDVATGKARLQLMEIYLGQGQPTAAYELFSQWHTKYPDDPTVQQMASIWADYLGRVRRFNPSFGR